jgi:hypothetical protein
MVNGEASEGSLWNLGKALCVNLEVWGGILFLPDYKKNQSKKIGERGRDRQFWGWCVRREGSGR